jgi:hypothetical protein
MIAKSSSKSERPNAVGGLALPAASGVGGTAGSARTAADALTSAGFLGVSHTSGAIMTSGPPVFLKVRVATTADMHYSTTINACVPYLDICNASLRSPLARPRSTWLMFSTASVGVGALKIPRSGHSLLATCALSFLSIARLRVWLGRQNLCL